jgi:hypothetical protein
MDMNKGSFDMPITRAVNAAAGQVLRDEAVKVEKRGKRTEGCFIWVGSGAGHFFNGWMLMFAVALIGFPLGYWPCVLIAYTVSCIIGSGTWSIATATAKIQKSMENK